MHKANRRVGNARALAGRKTVPGTSATRFWTSTSLFDAPEVTPPPSPAAEAPGSVGGPGRGSTWVPSPLWRTSW